MTETVTPNVERLDALVTWAAEEDAKRRRGEPSEWDQGVYLRRCKPSAWHCETVCCLAGKVVLEDGVPMRWASNGLGWLAEPGLSVNEYAAGVLGLDHIQAMYLFDAINNLDTVRALVDAIKQGVTGHDALSRIQEDRGDED